MEQWEQDLMSLNSQMARMSILAAKAMSEHDFKTSIEYFRGMAHISSQKACALRKLSKTHKNRVEKKMMIDSAKQLFGSRAEWLKQAEMIKEMEGRNGSAKDY